MQGSLVVQARASNKIPAAQCQHSFKGKLMSTVLWGLQLQDLQAFGPSSSNQPPALRRTFVASKNLVKKFGLRLISHQDRWSEPRQASVDIWIGRGSGCVDIDMMCCTGLHAAHSYEAKA